MTRKTNSSRVVFNTILLALMTACMGIITFIGVNKIQSNSKNFRGITDSPALCFDEETRESDGSFIQEKAYVCSTEVDENGKNLRLTDQNDYTMYLHDNITFTSVIRSNDLVVIMKSVGIMMTLLGLIVTVVYWNHNRG